MGSLAYLLVLRHFLAREVQTLAKSLMRLELSDSSGVLAHLEARSLFLDKIKTRQFEDVNLSKICDKVLQGESKNVVIDNEDVMRMCVCHVFDKYHFD